jgi:hypothetical protein
LRREDFGGAEGAVSVEACGDAFVGHFDAQSCATVVFVSLVVGMFVSFIIIWMYVSTVIFLQCNHYAMRPVSAKVLSVKQVG